MPKKQKVPSRRVRAGRKCTIHVSEVAPGEYEMAAEGAGNICRLMERAMTAGLRVVSGRPPNPTWRPLEATEPDPNTMVADVLAEDTEYYMNDLYSVTLERFEGMTHLSIKRNDKTRVREWRHLQQCKNELCGPECEAVEVFPAESRLVDNADQYHLWVFPEGVTFPLGFPTRTVSTPEQAEAWGRQRGVVVDQSPWAPGLTTGLRQDPEHE